jgi:hypothetical protein
LRVLGCFEGFGMFRTWSFWDLNDGRSGDERGFFIGESLMGVRMLSEFVDIELIDSIVAAILF